MIFIGSDGNEKFLLRVAKKYREAGLLTEVYYDCESLEGIDKSMNSAREKGYDVFITRYCESISKKFDILIFTNTEKNETIIPLNNIKKDGYVIINTDETDFFPYIIPDGIKVITCGVNSKALLTFSGICENPNGSDEILCCIQKEIKTISGRNIEPQEFSIRVRGKYGLSEVLVIITVMILGDIEDIVTREKLVFSK